jgi:hypothetical protein
MDVVAHPLTDEETEGLLHGRLPNADVVFSVAPSSVEINTERIRHEQG